MSPAEIMAAVVFGLAVFGAITGAFWRVWGLIAEARGSGEKASRDLADFKTHVAQDYATKDGMQRQTDSLLRAIESIGNRIDGLNERLDRAFEARPPARTRS